MNALDKLIINKTKVFVISEDDNEDGFTGIVIDYNIEDFYFYEKNECINVTVNIMPDKFTEFDDEDKFSDISLDRILISNNQINK